MPRVAAGATTGRAAAPAPAAPALEEASPPAQRKSKREPKNVRARMADVIIRIMGPEGTGPEWNPRRAGSEAHRHFEAMKGGITIREYLAKFGADEQRVARQWLWNTINDGYAKTLGG